jgi:hypothetical protein
MVGSPNGVVKAPNAPLAKTAPTVKGMEAPVETAIVIPNGHEQSPGTPRGIPDLDKYLP